MIETERRNDDSMAYPAIGTRRGGRVEKGQSGVSALNGHIGFAVVKCGIAGASITKKCEEEDKLCCIMYRILSS